MLVSFASAECEIAAEPPVSVVVVGTTATITVDGRSRTIKAKTCEELAKSAAVVIQMILAVPHRDSTWTTSSAPDAEPNSTRTTNEDDRTAPTEIKVDPSIRATVVADTNDVTAEAEIAPAAAVEHALVAAFGTSTSLGEALTFGLRWRWDTLSVNTEIAGELPGGIEMGTSVSIIRASAAFVPCANSGGFAFCAVMRAGFDHGSGSNLMNARSATEPRADLGARLAWEAAVSDHFSLQLRAEFAVSTTSSQFDVDQSPVWRSNRFMGLAGVGVVVRFP